MLLTVNSKQLPATFNQRVGGNVARFRRVTGMSQAELGRALGRYGFPMEQQTILTIERGSRPLKVEEAHAIAEVLGVEPEALSSPANERADLLGQVRAAELAIAAINAERDAENDRHRREIERLGAEVAQHEQQRQEAARRLVVLLDAEGRSDLASQYANPKPAESLIARSWRAARNG
jgi:transcriptional regulator with XRE-family HTH domain